MSPKAKENAWKVGPWIFGAVGIVFGFSGLPKCTEIQTVTAADADHAILKQSAKANSMAVEGKLNAHKEEDLRTFQRTLQAVEKQGDRIERHLEQHSRWKRGR